MRSRRTKGLSDNARARNSNLRAMPTCSLNYSISRGCAPVGLCGADRAIALYEDLLRTCSRNYYRDVLGGHLYFCGFTWTAEKAAWPVTQYALRW